jgi:uncharacterized protein HemX
MEKIRNMPTKKKSAGLPVAGLAAVAVAAAAGAYFLYGKNGASNRKKIRGWTLKAKGEILDQVEKMKEVTEDKYQAVIDKVAQKYQAVKDIDPKEHEQMAKELKSHWKSIKTQLAGKKK